MKVFRMQLDFFWQSVAVYAVTLIVYVMVKAMYDKTLQSGLVNVVFTDPIVVILGLFVFFSVISLIVNSVSMRSIRVDAASITFSNSLRERRFALDEIERIIIGKDRRRRAQRRILTIRIYVRGRRRPLRVLPSLYEREHELVDAVLALRHNGMAS